jgi:exodeoxyribonuclease V gamma subunit
LWLFELYPGKAEAALNFKERIPFFLEWALLRLLTVPVMPVRACALTVDHKHPWQDALNDWDEYLVLLAQADDRVALQARLDDLASRVAQLLTLWRQAQQQPLAYFPKTSWAALDSNKPHAATAAWWSGGFGHIGERDYAPGYARLLAGDQRFESGHHEYEELRALARRLHALTGFDAVEVAA